MGKKKKSFSRRRQREQQMRRRAQILAGLGVVLLVVGILFVRQRGGGNAAIEVHPEDVVYGEELFAVHEMDGPQLDKIPFLPKDGPQPRVAVPEAFYDFGEVGPTDVVEHTFYLVNTGEAPLTISRAYTTCGCTTARISATVIPPGKAAEVTVIFDAGYHDVRGQTVRRGVIIENNDPRWPQVELWIQAKVRR